jgi:hypothetical protein
MSKVNRLFLLIIQYNKLCIKLEEHIRPLFDKKLVEELASFKPSPSSVIYFEGKYGGDDLYRQISLV